MRLDDFDPYASPRARRGRWGSMYLNKEYMDYKNAMSDAVTMKLRNLGCKDLPYCKEGPVFLEILFVYKRTSSDPKRLLPCWRSRKPDVDNLDKTVMDACNGVLWADDAQVASRTSSKVIVDGPAFIGLEVSFKEPETVEDLLFRFK